MWLCQNCAKLVDNDHGRFTEAVLRDWKRTAERDSLATIGKTTKHSRPSVRAQEREIKRNLSMRHKIHRDFLRPLDERRLLGWKAKPHSKFAHSEVLIRSVEDTTYPEAGTRTALGISPWFKLELYDFYHNGIVGIVGLERGIIDREGRWAIVPHDCQFDPAHFRDIKIWCLARIPWRNIRHYDLDGDEYYNFPHLYCSFADGGTPYEDVTYALLGDDYDWPLDLATRIEPPRPDG